MKKFFVATVGIILMTTTACSSGTTDAPDNNDGGNAESAIDTSATFRYATSGGPSSFDPHKTKSGPDVLVLDYVYDRLIHRNLDGEAIPGLAEDWVLSPDLKTITFTLRDAMFSDGSEIDADAVVSNLNRAQEPDSITASSLEVISEVKAIDPKTVELVLDKPDGSVILELSGLAGMIVNPDAFGTPEKDSALTQAPGESGQFLLTESTPGTNYLFTSRDNYWDNPDMIQANALDFSVISDTQARINGVISGQLDCSLAEPALVAQTRGMSGVAVEAVPTTTISILYFNRTKGALANEKARQAISVALDRDSMVEGPLEGEGLAASQLWPEGYFAYDPDTPDITRDTDEAKRLLDEAGLPDGFSFETLTLAFPPFTDIAEIAQEQLKEVGIDMTIVPMSPGDIDTAFTKGEGDAIITAWGGHAEPSALLKDFFSEKSPQNASKEALPGFKDALNDANALPDENNERGMALGRLGNDIVAQGGVVPLAFNVLGSFCSEDVVGYVPPVIQDGLHRGVGVAGS